MLCLNLLFSHSKDSFVQLHHHIQTASEATTQTPVVLLHGLFGSYSNLNMLARGIKDRDIFQLDLRNHGQSGHSAEHNYELMAQDVIETLEPFKLEKVILIGHSMGGKVVMKIAALRPEWVEKLIVLDISPVHSNHGEHEQIFKALKAVEASDVQTRPEAMTIMREYLQEEMVIQFLMKSFKAGHWLFNVDALANNYPNILAWETIEPSSIPTLFIKGSKSPYISKEKHFQAIHQQFSFARIEEVEAGHWLHAEKTEQVMALILNMLDT